MPYSLQPVLLAQLDELLDGMYAQAALEPDQIEDLRSRALPYLRYVAGDERIDPREIKRFINTYTLQTLVRPELDRRIVLALQTIAFHPEWQAAYDMIMADWPSFRAALERYRTSHGEILGFVWPRGTAVPSDFLRYAGSALAAPLAEAQDLEPYLSSLQTAGNTPGWIRPAYGAVGEIRRILGELTRPGSGDDLVAKIRWQMNDLVSAPSDSCRRGRSPVGTGPWFHQRRPGGDRSGPEERRGSGPAGRPRFRARVEPGAARAGVPLPPPQSSVLPDRKLTSEPVPVMQNDRRGTRDDEDGPPAPPEELRDAVRARPLPGERSLSCDDAGRRGGT